MTPDLLRLLWAAAPVMLGVVAGFSCAVLGLRHWVAVSAQADSRNIVSSLRRVGARYLLGAVVVTAAGALWLAVHAPDPHARAMAPYALWGLPIGLACGLRWTYRRGA